MFSTPSLIHSAIAKVSHSRTGASQILSCWKAESYGTEIGEQPKYITVTVNENHDHVPGKLWRLESLYSFDSQIESWCTHSPDARDESTASSREAELSLLLLFQIICSVVDRWVMGV